MVGLEQLEHSGKHWSAAMIYVLLLGIQERSDHFNELLKSLKRWNKRDKYTALKNVPWVL